MAEEEAHGLDFLAGGGELGALIRAHDWTKTPLGPPSRWPQSLKTCVRIILTSRQPMFVWWGSELINLYNDPYKTIVGGKHPQALGQPASVVWREIWEQVGPRAENAMRRNEGTYDEALLLIMERYGYSEETYYTFSYSPVPNDEGGIGGIICANTDDTQRIIGERQLALLRELAAGTGDARDVEEACRQGARSLATNPRDLPFALIYLVDAERHRAVLAGASGIAPGSAAAPREIAIGDERVWPLSLALVNGEMRLVDLSASTLDLPTGAWNRPPHQAAMVAMPCGQGGAACLLIAGLNPYRLFDDGYQRLLHLVAGQLGAALANAQAYQEERRRAEALAELDRAKTIFFSNASHEFRTPLTLMLSPLEDMLVRHATAATLVVERREVELVHRNGLRLLRLVNTLLDFSRIEAGRMTAAYEPVDLARYTAELASTFRSAMQRAGLGFTVDCPPFPEPIYVDRDMWEKVVLNLVSNAFKYTLEGEVVVSLRPAPEGSGVLLSVRDTGVGIPPHELPRLFERFHRIEGQRGRTQEGTGIGLALVQELARLHGGTVAVESAVGRGTCFTVRFPAGTAHLPADRIRHDGAQRGTGVGAEAFVEEALRWLPGDRPSVASSLDGEFLGALPDTALRTERAAILLADDNADMRDYVRRLLAGRYAVEAMADGQAALEAARLRPPDLLLSDVMMLRLDGFGLLKAWRADPALREVPVILLSARAGEEAKVEGLEAGADDYLVKPFSARELLARVDANIALARLRRERQAELRRLNETLEQRIAAETAQRMKAEEALRHSQKMEAIGQLTGGIAHDFNNLLQVILGNLDALRRRAAAERGLSASRDWQRMTEAALRGAERAAVMTQRLLAFSRRQPLDPKPTDVNRLMSGMSELLRRTLGETIAIETVSAGGLWSVLVDANQLESAILNLAVNARDAMPRGGKLTIETTNAFLDEGYAALHQDVSPGQYVLVSVTDSGAGMSKDVLERAFDPFFTTKDVGQGTGLGLSQVYGFVKQSGGHVKIYSEPGDGTTVKLYLPRLAAGTAAAPGQAAAVLSPKSHAGELLLLVEDDEDVRSATAEMLGELGYQVISARDGAAALQLLKQRPDIRLLFTDVGLPGGLNGRQLADAVRALRPDLPVLFTTGYARNAIVHHGRLDPGVELLVKPFTFAALAQKLRQALRPG